MILRPFNIYLSWSMCLNLFIIFCCIWGLIGFIGYGISTAQEYERYKRIKEDFGYKIFLLILFILCGFFSLYFPLKEYKFCGLRFW